FAGGSTGSAGRPKDNRDALPVHRPKSLAPRAEMGRATTHHDAPNGPSAAGARFAAALVDLQPLLHHAVTVGRGVVVDRTPAALDGFREHPTYCLIQPLFVGRSERCRGPERMEAGRPQRLVGVDVADAGEERLVEQERL